MRRGIRGSAGDQPGGGRRGRGVLEREGGPGVAPVSDGGWPETERRRLRLEEEVGGIRRAPTEEEGDGGEDGEIGGFGLRCRGRRGVHGALSLRRREVATVGLVPVRLNRSDRRRPLDLASHLNRRFTQAVFSFS